MGDPAADPLTMTFETAWRLYADGRLAEARRLVEAPLRATPRDARLQFVLGLVEIGEGARAAGLRRIEEQAADFVPPAPVCQGLGEMRFGQGEYARAAAWLQRSLAQDPTRAPAWTSLGNALRQLGRPAEAEQALRRGTALAPGREEGYVSLAFLLRELHRPVDAAAAMLELARAAADRPEVLEKTLGFLEDLGQLEAAGEVALQLLSLAADDAGLQARAGRLLSKLGRFDAAADCFRRALALDPATDTAYLGLSVIKRFSTPDDPDAALIREALARGDPGESALTCGHFALGKILDDCGEHVAAFGHFREANERRRRSRPFHLEAYLARMRRLRETFTAATLAGRAAHSPASPTPVFVVGMMRSGTTLVERILDSHPQVHGAGELDFVESIASALGVEASDAPLSAEPPLVLEPQRLQGLAREGRATLAGLSRGEPMVVDKNPGNFAYLGLLALLFPDAKFVHCVRDPLDTCLSIYFQHFAREGNAWSYDLQWIGEVYADYRRTMAHWNSVMPGAIFEVDYGALVRDTPSVTRALLDVLGLPFDPACLEFHRNRRPVGTASVWQARQPVYTESVGRWRHYAAQLEPLRRQLLAAGVAVEADGEAR